MFLIPLYFVKTLSGSAFGAASSPDGGAFLLQKKTLPF